MLGICLHYLISRATSRNASYMPMLPALTKVEPSCLNAVQNVIDNPQWTRLQGKVGTM